MLISFATQNDESAVRAMWKYCFHDSEEYMDVFFKFVYKPENTVVAYENRTPIGSVQLIPNTIVSNGVEMEAVYIGGLCVLPSYRGKKVAKELMHFAEEHMKKLKIKISFLVPFSFDFYRKLGYECISYLSEISGPIANLKPYIQSEQTMYPLTKPPIEIYRRFTKHFSLFTKRDATVYETEIFPLCMDAYCYALDDNGGYILYTISDCTLHVLEIAYENEVALKNILGFIYAHRAELNTFCIRTSADGFLRKLLCDESISETRFPHAMCKTFEEIAMPDAMQNYINMLGWF